MAVVLLSLTIFRDEYPEFSELSDGVITACWNQASLYCCNTDASHIVDVAKRRMLLNMLVAHIAALRFGVKGQAPNGLVGRIANASEGSVSVSVDFGRTTINQQWFSQTQYGAMFWQASAPYRSGFYIAPTGAPIVFVPRG